MKEKREPSWQVLAVFHNEDDSRDFAYTLGLAERGLPEVHMWARPDAGEDPGHDWRFSPHDAAVILNELAWRLIDGRIAPGDTYSRRFDAGMVQVAFELGDPVEAASLDAYQAEPSSVMPLRWSLHRAPEGALVSMDDDAIDVAESEYVRLSAGPRRSFDSPGEIWTAPTVPSWDPGQRWGPRTPLVAAHAGVICAFSPEDMIGLVNIAFPLEAARSAGHPQLVARAAARSVGRSAALDRLAQDTSTLVDGLGLTWGRSAWPAARDWLDGDDSDDRFPEGDLRRMVKTIVTSHLLTVAVADQLTTDQELTGTGPVAFAATIDGLPPDGRWHAAPHIVDLVVGLLADVDAAVAAARAWRLVDNDLVMGARGDLQIAAIHGPSMFPDLSVALPPSLLDDVRQATLAHRVTGAVVQSWLSVLATVLTHRAHLRDETVAAVVEVGSVMPGLAVTLNTPVAV
ncbi:DUF4262 domain-containing protein [Nocardioides sp. KC13]|uniref:DUF4262 domain-containing protein n=1 Tax=Nocardioides turkmenicus TaxID=2711220 RepID=A0A6M1QTE2_9ACTN|nr:DUF4262 domain-containing protein [Nocardioides sp. KC13]NGN93075.1 DUF4262 domain-containing protein [Nocardioides sp. KC13]